MVSCQSKHATNFGKSSITSQRFNRRNVMNTFAWEFKQAQIFKIFGCLWILSRCIPRIVVVQWTSLTGMQGNCFGRDPLMFPHSVTARFVTRFNLWLRHDLWPHNASICDPARFVTKSASICDQRYTMILESKLCRGETCFCVYTYNVYKMI